MIHPHGEFVVHFACKEEEFAPYPNPKVGVALNGSNQLLHDPSNE